MCLRNRAGLLLAAETRGTFCPPRLPLFMVCPWGSDPHTSSNASSIVKLGPILHIIVQSSLGRQQGQNTERGGQRGKKRKKENHLIANRAGHYLFIYLGQEEGEGVVGEEGGRSENGKSNEILLLLSPCNLSVLSRDSYIKQETQLGSPFRLFQLSDAPEKMHAEHINYDNIPISFLQINDKETNKHCKDRQDYTLT